MRVVFLDFDGVLNARTTEADDACEMWSAAWLDEVMVHRLASLVERTRAEVVVSSSWRQRRSPEELAAILEERGFSGGVFDVTSRLPRPPEGERLVRAAEIRAWLAHHPDVRSFVILDDEADFGELADRHVRTDPDVGLSSSDVARASAILLLDAADHPSS
jgi:hypothetical protein